MILVELCREYNNKTGKEEVWISHGVDNDTGENIVMEQVLLSQAPYVIHHPDYGYILKEGIIK